MNVPAYKIKRSQTIVKRRPTVSANQKIRINVVGLQSRPNGGGIKVEVSMNAKKEKKEKEIKLPFFKRVVAAVKKKFSKVMLKISLSVIAKTIVSGIVLVIR